MRYLCIHGHFYQPPRENAWLEAIEQQDSAYPYHDWNERITSECYAPNGASRVLDAENRIIKIVNNYAGINTCIYGNLSQRHLKRFKYHLVTHAQIVGHLVLIFCKAFGNFYRRRLSLGKKLRMWRGLCRVWKSKIGRGLPGAG